MHEGPFEIEREREGERERKGDRGIKCVRGGKRERERQQGGTRSFRCPHRNQMTSWIPSLTYTRVPNTVLLTTQMHPKKLTKLYKKKLRNSEFLHTHIHANTSP